MVKHEGYIPYRTKSPAGQDAHLAERKLMLRIPLGRASVRQAHTLFVWFPYIFLVKEVMINKKEQYYEGKITKN